MRVWYQCFLGFKPDLRTKVVKVEPHIPSELSALSCFSTIGKGKIKLEFERKNEDNIYRYTVDGFDGLFVFSAKYCLPVELKVNDGDELIFIENALGLKAEQIHSEGSVEKFTYHVNTALASKYKKLDSLFENLSFAAPFLAPDLKALRNYHEEALTY
jgi:hypothetical protein